MVGSLLLGGSGNHQTQTANLGYKCLYPQSYQTRLSKILYGEGGGIYLQGLAGVKVYVEVQNSMIYSGKMQGFYL